MIDIKIVNEWLAQANEDLGFASVSLKEQDRFFSRICFHFQQAAEKYLKAFIVANELGLKKIHNLACSCKLARKEIRILKN